MTKVNAVSESVCNFFIIKSTNPYHAKFHIQKRISFKKDAYEQFEGAFITIEEADNVLEGIAEQRREFDDCDYERGDKAIEDDVCVYRILTRQEMLEDYTDDELNDLPL